MILNLLMNYQMNIRLNGMYTYLIWTEICYFLEIIIINQKNAIATAIEITSLRSYLSGETFHLIYISSCR